MEGTSDVLFAKGIPVTLKQPSTRSGGLAGSALTSPFAGRSSLQATGGFDLFQEKRHPSITVHVALSSKSSGRLKVLELQLTDESDPFFLYHLDVGEDDFHALKEEQNLLVDFQQFPVKFIELLEACIAAQRDEQPKFIAQLTSDPSAKYATFSVVETNTFRNITHISLQFIPGADTAIKQYLAQLVKDYKAENAALKTELNSTGASLSSRLKDTEMLAANLTTELERIKLANADQINKLQLHHAEALATERENNIRQREEERITAEREKRSIELKYEEKLQSLTQELTSLRAAHSHMLAHAQSVETSSASANKQVDALRRELSLIKQELEKELQTNKQLSHSKADLEAECTSLRNNLANLEREGRDKAAGEKRLEELLQMANEQKAKVDETLEVYKNQNTRLEEGLKQATEEINKGNEIIRRLQGELKSLKAKLKLKNVVTLQQEKLLDERAATVQSQQKEVSDLKESIRKAHDDLQASQSRIEDLSKQVQEGKAIIEDNNHVIEWLHKQLNEDALTRSLPVYSNLSRPTTGIPSTEDSYKRASPTGYRSRYLSGMESHDKRTSADMGLRSASRIPYSQGTQGKETAASNAPLASSAGLSRLPSPPKMASNPAARYGAGLGTSMGGLVSGQSGAEMTDRYVANGVGTAPAPGIKSNYF